MLEVYISAIAGFHATSLKFKLQSYWNYRAAENKYHKHFHSEWVLGLVIEYDWISKFKSDLFREVWLSALLLYKEKVLFSLFWVPRAITSRFCSNTQWQMFLLVSARHVGAHLGGHQHGVSIQISINLGKTFLRISSIGKIAVTWISAIVFAYLSFFLFSDSGFYLSNRFFFLFWSILSVAWHLKPATGFCGITFTSKLFIDRTRSQSQWRWLVMRALIGLNSEREARKSPHQWRTSHA